MTKRLTSFAAYACSLFLTLSGVFMMHSPSVELEVIGVIAMLVGVTFAITNFRITLNDF